jgi:flagellar protein FliL
MAAIVGKLKEIIAKPGVARVGIIGVAVVLGGLLGSQLIAPRLIAARSAKPPSATEEKVAGEVDEKNAERKEAEKREAGKKEGGHKKEGREGGGEEDVKGILLNIDNIIVNPAGSQGSRFLMASIAIELPDNATETYMREHEVQVRDLVISVLESQTMQTLSRPGARDQLKEDLADALMPMSGGAAWLRVYIPQFVIQ